MVPRLWEHDACRALQVSRFSGTLAREHALISLIGSSQLTQQVEQIVNVPQFIHIGAINPACVTRVREQVNAALQAGYPVIPMVIDSPGGSVHSFFALVDIINGAKKYVGVSTIVNGRAMSCAADLLACGTTGLRYVSENSSIMVHHSMVGLQGKIGDVVSDAGAFSRLNGECFKLLDKNTKKRAGYWQKAIKDRGGADWFLNAKEAVKLGLADKVGSPVYAVKVSVDYAFE